MPAKPLSFFILIFCFHQQAVFAQSADLIFTNGKIFTSDTSMLFVEALAIKGNTIVATGANADIERLASAGTKKINLVGQTVVPGFNDAHEHPGWDAKIGLSYQYTQMTEQGLSRQAVLDSVSALVQLAKPGQWITGAIGTAVLGDAGMRKALDSIAPDNPVALSIWWGHGTVVNGMALKASGLSDKDPDPVGGWYSRDSTKKIFALYENAQVPVWYTRSIVEPGNYIDGIRSFSRRQIERGITTVQFMGTGLKNAMTASQYFKKANLQQRARIIAWPQSDSKSRKIGEWKNINAAPGSLAYFSGIKYMIDGTPMEQNSLFSHAYENRSGWYGKLNFPKDTIKQILKEALVSKEQLMLHITGDSSLSIVLTLMMELGDGQAWKPRRVRIEHNPITNLSSDQISKIKELGIVIMHTPKYNFRNPLRSLVDSGVEVGFAPDGTTNPFVDIMMATSAMARPDENITIEQAVIAYTHKNAFAEFAEEKKGMLKAGMLADLVVLSQDIFTIPAGELPATTSVLTMIDGNIVFTMKKIKK